MRTMILLLMIKMNTNLLLSAELQTVHIRFYSHLLYIDLLGVMIYFIEFGPLVSPCEDVAPGAPHPAVLVEPQQGGVHPHAAAPLVHPVGV